MEHPKQTHMFLSTIRTCCPLQKALSERMWLQCLRDVCPLTAAVALRCSLGSLGRAPDLNFNKLSQGARACWFSGMALAQEAAERIHSSNKLQWDLLRGNAEARRGVLFLKELANVLRDRLCRDFSCNRRLYPGAPHMLLLEHLGRKFRLGSEKVKNKFPMEVGVNIWKTFNGKNRN